MIALREPIIPVPSRVATFPFASESVIPDIAATMETYLQAHVGEDTAGLSLVGFPDLLLTAVDKVRERTTIKPRPGFSSVVGHCLEAAITLWEDDPAILRLRQQKRLFDRNESPDGDAEEVVAGFFRGFKVEVTISGNMRRKNVHVPLTTKKALSDIANDLGSEVASFAIISLMLVLAHQSGVNAESRAKMAREVATYRRRAQLRADGTAALMEALL